MDHANSIDQLRPQLVAIAQRATAAGLTGAKELRTVLLFTYSNARKWGRELQKYGLATVDE